MNNVMNAYAKMGVISDARKVFIEMPVKNVSSYNTLLSAYAKQGKTREALCIFNELPKPDSVSWTAMIVGYNQKGHFNAALRIFLEMMKCNVVPNEYTDWGLDMGKKVHSFVVKFGFSGIVFIANSLLNLYAKSGDAGTAVTVFERLIWV
ncbi:hypothetical protein ACS0TY_033876 [Phlomoides rotata]